MDHVGRIVSALLPTGGSQSSNVVSASCSDPTRCSELQAVKAAKALYDLFRFADADNPDVFLAGTVRLFMHYPVDVVMRVVDPITGIPGKQKWPPAPADVKEALDVFMAADAAKAKRDRDLERQLADRRAFEARQVATTQEERDRAVRRYLEEIRPGLATTADLRNKVGEEAWNSLPNAGL